MREIKSEWGGLLNGLSRAQGRHVSGSHLGSRLGLSRAAVHKRIQRLRKEGYVVVGTNRLGYRLAESFKDFLRTPQKTDLGHPLYRFSVLPSTQEEAKKRVIQGAGEGTLVLADRQTAGRGRLGRSWFSPLGGLWCSLILRPESLDPARAPALALVAALDWVHVLNRAIKVPARVKWPNDVWIHNRKVAGILTEMASEVGRVHWMVLGMGININNLPPSSARWPAVSLRQLKNKSVPVRPLLNAWLRLFSQSYARFLRKGFTVFRHDYEKWSGLKNDRVTVKTSHGRFEGNVKGVDAEGRLVLRTPAGDVPVWEGDVSLVRLSRRSR